MKDKYYTPKIEEFYVGFEFYVGEERCICTRVELLPQGNFVSGSNVSSSVKDRGFNKYRIEDIKAKYLDKEDLLELGWERGHILDWDGEFLDGFAFDVEMDRIDQFYAYFEDGYLTVYTSYCYNEHSGNTENEFRFKGKIKNKSELKKLMEQLEINPS